MRFSTILLLLAAGVLAVIVGCQPGGDAARKETMKNAQAVRKDIERPPIDLAQPAKFETATFALG
ncbi:MAG: hypothetical protein KA801_16185 [Syntrophorhabdaceae bacterium]|nr:hypothetical protein [Syntrophorhabdaceae bacterium]